MSLAVLQRLRCLTRTPSILSLQQSCDSYRIHRYFSSSGDGKNDDDDSKKPDAWNKGTELPSWLRYSISEREKQKKESDAMSNDMNSSDGGSTFSNGIGSPGELPVWLRRSREERMDVLDEKGLFTKENTAGMSMSEIAKLKRVYEMLQEHIKVADGEKDSLNVIMNPMLDVRTLMSKKLPRVSVEVLKEFRKMMSGEEAGDAKIQNLHQAWFGHGARGGGNEGLSSELLIEKEDQKAWKKVHEQTLRKESLNSLRFQRIKGFQERTMDNQGGGDNLVNTFMGNGTRQNGKGKQSLLEMAGLSQEFTKGNRKRYVLRNEQGKVDVDYRSVGILEAFLSEGGKILPRTSTHLSAKSQKRLAKAVKTARQIGLLAPEKRHRMTVEDYEAFEAALQ
eukprot:Plantae.Rhodophyta-Hildenbrandia_rubra.ctg17716.p1 GENE.Plantae.Rhodophyta-Hildenbrandia_rubra.ctg17716~~Plantae.Rhodophyta-Hildenbrandia_rubra.ctg17716.p1  ORF type:complete len:393 (+),score=90.29 Plantae.Rhodophyta-Hildenbrandia_rubra.ctg17716:50-1228(+)